MEFKIRRKDNNILEAKAGENLSVNKSFSDFFKGFKDAINRRGYINNFYFDDHTIFVEKNDFTTGLQYMDSYAIDVVLESDKKFMDDLAELLVYYDEHKETYIDSNEASGSKDEFWLDMKACSVGQDMLIEYCKTGSFTVPSDPEILKRVYEKYKFFPRGICEEYSVDDPTCHTTRINDAKSNALLVSTWASALTCVGISLITFKSCAGDSTLTSTGAAALAGFIACGAGAIYLNYLRDKRNMDMMMRKCEEITFILEELYNMEEKSEEEVYSIKEKK